MSTLSIFASVQLITGLMNFLTIDAIVSMPLAVKPTRVAKMLLVVFFSLETLEMEFLSRMPIAGWVIMRGF